MSTDVPSSEESRKKRDAGRRWGAAVVALTGAACVAISSYSGVFRICRDQLFVVGGAIAAGRTCQPLGFSDLSPLLILILALLWRDISSLGIFGVNMAKHEQKRLGETLTLLLTAIPAADVLRFLDQKDNRWLGSDTGARQGSGSKPEEIE